MIDQGRLKVFTVTAGRGRRYGLTFETNGGVNIDWLTIEELAREEHDSLGRDVAQALLAVRDANPSSGVRRLTTDV